MKLRAFIIRVWEELELDVYFASYEYEDEEQEGITPADYNLNLNPMSPYPFPGNDIEGFCKEPEGYGLTEPDRRRRDELCRTTMPQAVRVPPDNRIKIEIDETPEE